jgi:hypothetical protein
MTFYTENDITPKNLKKFVAHSYYYLRYLIDENIINWKLILIFSSKNLKFVINVIIIYGYKFDFDFVFMNINTFLNIW